MNKKGFTLVELLAVVLIVAILSGVALPQYRKVVEKARLSEAESMMRTIYDPANAWRGSLATAILWKWLKTIPPRLFSAVWICLIRPICLVGAA